jgi:hypothetical protein
MTPAAKMAARWVDTGLVNSRTGKQYFSWAREGRFGLLERRSGCSTASIRHALVSFPRSRRYR